MLQLDRAAFIRDHWQRKPLLLRGALPGYQCPISADELAGLALEPGIESRLVSGSDSDWQIEHGPFHEASFQRPGPWTLLVQALDHHVEEIAALRQAIDFLPGWRFDDIMCSYATPGGSVGPHFDNYDVLLLQARGTREWRIGQACDSDEALLPHADLRLLANFNEQERHVLEAGDILYVPPRLAHWGIGGDDCMTLSLGFRAPRLSDLVSRWADDALERINPEHFYTDPADLQGAGRAGEITARTLAQAREQALASLQQASDDWFGELVSEPRYPVADTELASLVHSRGLRLDPASRLAWREHGNALAVYLNGSTLAADATCIPLLIRVCSGETVSGQALADALADPAQCDLLNALREGGALLDDD